MTGTSVANKVYDGNLTASLSSGTLSGVMLSDVVTLTQAGSFANKNVGSAISVAANDSIGGADFSNYTLLQPTGLSANITPAPLTVIGTSVANKVYDGTLTATVSNGTLSGVVLGETVTLTQAGSFVTKNVGSAISVTANDSIGGSAASNYTLTEPTGLAANITAAPLTVIGTSAVNKVYDGTATATLINGSLVGVMSGDTVTLTQAGTFPAKVVGTGLVVTANDSLAGADFGNYTIVQPTGLTADISKAPLLVTATGINKVYDSTTNASVTIADSPLGSDAVSVNYSANYLDKNVGTNKYIAVSGITLSGADANNYQANSTTSTFATITPATLTVASTSVTNKTYDGTTVATLTNGTLVGLFAGDVVALTEAGGFASKNVGSSIAVTASDSISGTDFNNYTLVQPTGLSANITPAPLVVVGTSVANKVYDGNVTATLYNGNLIGLMSGDLITLNQAGGFTSKDVGDSIAVTASDSLNGSSASNYTLIQPTGLMANITPAPITITANNATKTYGVTLGFSGTEFSISGLKNNETVETVSLGSTGTVNNAGVSGNPYSIVVSNATGGTFTSSNYTIIYVNGVLTITPAKLVVTANDQSKVGGAPDPAFTYTYSGLTAGDTDSVFSGALGRVAGESAGYRAITQNTLTAGNNYTITYIGANLKVTAPTLATFAVASSLAAINSFAAHLGSASNSFSAPVTSTTTQTAPVTVAATDSSFSAPATSTTTQTAPVTVAATDSSPATSAFVTALSSGSTPEAAVSVANQTASAQAALNNEQVVPLSAANAAVAPLANAQPSSTSGAEGSGTSSNSSQGSSSTTNRSNGSGGSSTASNSEESEEKGTATASTATGGAATATASPETGTTTAPAATASVSTTETPAPAVSTSTTAAPATVANVGTTEAPTPAVTSTTSAPVATASVSSGNATPVQETAQQSLVSALASGATPDVAFSATTQSVAAQAALTTAQTVPVSSSNQVAAALSSGGSVATALQSAGVTGGGNDAVGQSLVAALAGGSSPAEAMASAQQVVAAQAALSSAQTVPVSSSNQVASALSSGGNVATALQSAGVTGGSNDAVGQSLVAALAGGASPAEALASAQQVAAAQAALSSAQTVPVSSSNQVASALSSGGNMAAALQSVGVTGGGNDAVGQALVAALAGGSDPAAALAAAQQAAAAQSALNKAQTVTTTPADATVALLTSGANPAAALANTGGSAYAGTALVAALSSGESPAEAMAAMATAAAAQAELSKAQTVAVSPSAQAVAVLTTGGNVADALHAAGIPNTPEIGQAMMAALAAGQTPEQAIAAATATTIAQTTLTIAQTVPMSKTDQVLATLASGATSADVTARTGVVPLITALFSGVAPEVAVMAANENTDAVAALIKAQTVAVSPTDQVVGSLAASGSATAHGSVSTSSTQKCVSTDKRDKNHNRVTDTQRTDQTKVKGGK